MENFTKLAGSLRSLRRRYPALYECDCLFLSRRSGKFRPYAEVAVAKDLARLVRTSARVRPFVVVFNRTGGCLAEARILLLLRRYAGACALRVVVIEPLVETHASIAAAVESFGCLVEEVTGSKLLAFNNFDEYAESIREKNSLRADAVVVIDSDERADLIFALDTFSNHTAVARLVRLIGRFPLYVARLGVDQCHGGASRHLHRSLLAHFGTNLFVLQLFSTGFDALGSPLPFFWRQGEQLFENELQAVLPSGVEGLLMVCAKNFLRRGSFAALYQWFSALESRG